MDPRDPSGKQVCDPRRHRRLRLVRGQSSDVGRPPPADAEIVVGDLTSAATLGDAVDGVTGVVFTHGSHGGAKAAERVDYGAVRNVLEALGNRPVRIALMTAIGVTKHTPGHDWKRRGERLVRASGLPYTIVRPGWFDYNEPGGGTRSASPHVQRSAKFASIKSLRSPPPSSDASQRQRAGRCVRRCADSRSSTTARGSWSSGMFS
jgi:uncharacterized protein YbjT (DUF2867 family)